MNEKILLQAVSMDLLRTALGIHRGSLSMAKVFSKEVSYKLDQLRDTQDSHVSKLVRDTKKYLSTDKKENADHLLMYSVLFKNYAKNHE